jgi:hypothetical protein
VELADPKASLGKKAAPLSAAVIRLVIADDHAVVLKGLQSVLGTELDIAVVADCTTGEQAIKAA